MAWVRARDGTLVNLERAVSVQCRAQPRPATGSLDIVVHLVDGSAVSLGAGPPEQSRTQLEQLGQLLGAVRIGAGDD